MGMTLEQMKNVDIRTVDADTLIDIREVHTIEDLPQAERVKDFIRQIKNPYCFLVDGVIVKLSFPDHGPTLTDRLESLMQKI
jgi:hypothetical protein